MSITFPSMVCLIIIMFYSAHGLLNNNNNVLFSFRFMFFVSRSKSIISSSVADWRSCFPCMLDIFTMWEWKIDTNNLFSFEWSLTETLANHCLCFFFFCLDRFFCFNLQLSHLMYSPIILKFLGACAVCGVTGGGLDGDDGDTGDFRC